MHLILKEFLKKEVKKTPIFVLLKINQKNGVNGCKNKLLPIIEHFERLFIQIDEKFMLD